MLENIPIPTDNIYKTSFFLGLVLLACSLIPFYYRYQLKVEQVRLSGEKKGLENRRMWLEEDREIHKNEVAKLNEIKKGEWKELPKLDPNTEEYKKIFEATGQKEDPNNLPRDIFVIDIRKLKQAVEKKNKVIKETQEKLNKANNKLVYTERDILVSEVQIRTKQKEIDQNDKFSTGQLHLGILEIFLGTFFVVYGGYNWLTKTQKYQDRIEMKQAQLKTKQKIKKDVDR